MRRRSLVLLVSAVTLCVLGILVVTGVLYVTRSSPGREWLRGFIESTVASKVPGGKIHIGKLGGNFLTKITIDTVAIRDQNDELFLSTGRVAITFDPRDFADYRVVLRKARIEHPYVHIVQHEDGTWNFKRILASKDNKPEAPIDVARRKWGDYVVIDSARARNGTFLLTLPWHPDTSLRGARRDSSIRAHVNNPQKYVAKRSDGWGRTYTWKNAHGLLRHARLADPDSTHLGRRFVIDTLSADEFEPTFKFRKVSGEVTHLGDTLWINVPHFELPASKASARGKVWWGSNLPVRYDIAIRGDTVALDDVNWAYPTLPRTGGGSLDLLIQNDPKNLRIVDFHLKRMDVRSTKSHLTGNMSFGVGAPVLLVRGVDLRADPVDFDLIRTLNGKPFPYDWRGQLFGTVKARGGPLTNFVVDDAGATFNDANVRGAVSRFTARGELDILLPAFTTFHGFDVDAETLDLRTIQFLNPNFPRMGGTVSGTATLDSSWLDVRFSNANLAHQDGPGEPSRVTGSGRVTWGDLMTYDVTLDAQPLSMTMLARSYPGLAARGLVSGPIRARGQATDLEVEAALQGNAGALSFAGRLDIDSIGGYGARGRGSFSRVNIARLLEKPTIPTGTLSGRYETEVSGATAASLRGSASLDLDPTVFDSLRVYGTRARVEFADGRMRIVDSLRVQSVAGTLVARGGLGLPKGRADSLDLSLTVDSLGGLRRYLRTVRDTTILAGAAAVADSLAGTAEFRGKIAGTMDAFRLSGRGTGRELYMNKHRGESARLTLDLRDLPRAANGVVELYVDTVTLASIALEKVGGSLALIDPKHARFSASALSTNGPMAAAIGTWERDNAEQRFVVDSLGISIADSRWHLASPARIALDSSGGLRINSTTLRNRDSAVVVLAADVPARGGAASAHLRATRVPLADIGVLAQLRDTLSGLADANITVMGTKNSPDVVARADLRSMVWGAVGIDSVRSTGTYRAGRFLFQLDATRNGKPALQARGSLPAAVTLFSVGARNDSVSVSVRADTTDLEILKALPGLASAKMTGRLTAEFDVGGTWRAPAVTGNLRVIDGRAEVPQLGVTFASINGSVIGVRRGAGRDSLSIDITASSEGRPNGTVRLRGHVNNLLQAGTQQTFALTFGARNFHAFNKRSAAELYISTVDSIRLTGTTRSPTLTGSLIVDRGAIFLADRDIARKQAVEFTIDTTAGQARATSALFNTLMTNLRVSGVTITLGDDVRLRSAEADVKLSGSLQLQASTNRSRRIASTSGALIPLFDLDGALQTEGGRYTVNLGVVQREFTVLTGGTVTFDGDPNNPLLNIHAQHNVRRPGDKDLGVIVNLHGRLLPFPVIDFSSTAEYSIATSDLLSYLLIGRPGFDYGADARTAQTLVEFIAPTVSAIAADQLRQRLGSFVDAIQFQLGSTPLNGGSANDGLTVKDYLYGATIGAEKQFKNIFVSLNTGFCQFQSGTTFDPKNSLGAKAEYRFAPELSLKLSYDPPTKDRVCGLQNIIGLFPTPGQFGLSFSHAWRF